MYLLRFKVLSFVGILFILWLVFMMLFRLVNEGGHSLSEG